MRVLVLVAGILFGGLASAHAEEPQPLRDAGLIPVTVRATATVRLRYERSDQFTVKGYGPGTDDAFLLERLRLNLDFRSGAATRFFLQIQDAHVHGTRFGPSDFKGSHPYEDILDIRQAFFEWRRIGGTPLGIRVGRQQISYGDQRVFGPGEWGNTGRYAWDAAQLLIETGAATTELWVGRFLHNRPELWPNRPAPGPTYAVAHSRLRRLPFALDLFYVLKHSGASSADGLPHEWRHSLGFQLEGEVAGTFAYGATAVAQVGSLGSDSVRAFGTSVSLGLRLPLPWRPRLGIEWTWGSGDGRPGDGLHQTFDGVLGGADIRFYGLLNLFFWANLHDLEVNAQVDPWPTLRIKAAYHAFFLDASRDAWYTTSLAPLRRDPTGAAGTALGQEVDLQVRWTPLPWLEVRGFFGRFFPGEYVYRTGEAPPATWLALQLLFRFR